MYESFYGLREKPFLLSPDSDFLYLSKSHQAALSRLEYVLVSQPGISVITGEYGSGKTTIIRKLLKKKYDYLTVGLVTQSAVKSFEELMQWILYAYDLPFEFESGAVSRVSMYDRFTEFLVSQFAEDKRVILIIDEAQNLHEECLEQLRLMTNVNADKNDLLQLILIGETELRDSLKLPQMRAFVQRVAVDCAIENLTLEETTAYISYRISAAGGNGDLFTSSACDSIFRATRGNPSKINTICDTALLYGFAEQKTQIDHNLVNIVIREKQRGISSVTL